jgi:hypothetical protein
MLQENMKISSISLSSASQVNVHLLLIDLDGITVSFSFILEFGPGPSCFSSNSTVDINIYLIPRLLNFYQKIHQKIKY